MFEKLEKTRAELKRAKAKRDEWDAKVKALEKKCEEAEKTSVHELMVEAELTPEQLAKLIQYSKHNLPGNKTIEEITNQKNETEENEDEE